MSDPDVYDEIRKLRDDFSTLQSDVADLTDALRRSGANHLEDARASASDQVRRSRARLRRQAEAARERSREAVDDLEDTIGGHPMSSVAMAFGAGFIAAKLIDLGVRR
jgi:ElaB/YqjD/DUF883 family membrane-anchored ribosome-binding protein